MKKLSNRKILWLITARSGSKSIPDKNIKLLGGHPLIAYRICSALTFAEKEDVWISTDSKQYANIAESYSATVPFLRPRELATDKAKSMDVVSHAMDHAESLDFKYDAIGLLEPTSPFVYPKNLLDAVERLFSDPEAESIVAVREVRPSTFYVQEESKYLDKISANIASSGTLRRQEERIEITPSGGFYIAKWNSLKNNHTFYTAKTLALLVGEFESLEIDEPIDWEWAEFLIARNKVSLPELGVSL